MEGLAFPTCRQHVATRFPFYWTLDFVVSCLKKYQQQRQTSKLYIYLYISPSLVSTVCRLTTSTVCVCSNCSATFFSIHYNNIVERAEERHDVETYQVVCSCFIGLKGESIAGFVYPARVSTGCRDRDVSMAFNFYGTLDCRVRLMYNVCIPTDTGAGKFLAHQIASSSRYN